MVTPMKLSTLAVLSTEPSLVEFLLTPEDGPDELATGPVIGLSPFVDQVGQAWSVRTILSGLVVI